MLIAKLCWRVVRWLETVLFLQAICVLTSTPILYFWQMPTSCNAPLGNIIFAPFMSAFILLSALLFCFGLCGLYFKKLFWLFDWLVQTWLSCLKQASVSWLFIPNAVTMLSWLCGCLMLLWLWQNRAQSRLLRRSLIGWLLLFSVASVMQRYTQPLQANFAKSLPKGKQQITVKQTAAGLSLVDHGVFGKLATPEKFIVYQLKSFLLRHFDCAFIHDITLPRPSKRYLQAAKLCTKLLHCQQIYWQKPAKSAPWAGFTTSNSAPSFPSHNTFKKFIL